MERLVANFAAGIKIITLGNLTQWDKDVLLHISGSDLPNIFEIHIGYEGISKAYKPVIAKNGEISTITIPNELLQQTRAIKVWIYAIDREGCRTERTVIIPIDKREKPSGYIYEPTDILTIEKAVKNALQEAKENGDFKGEQGEKGPKGDPGDGYVITAEDKLEIAEDVVSSPEVQEAMENSETALIIAKGKSKGYVFNTVADLDLWLENPANIKDLNQGDNLYIRDIQVPDYWWDGQQKQQLETQKVNLENYIENDDIDQTYSPTSPRPQSGTAVAEGIDMSVGDIASVLQSVVEPENIDPETWMNETVDRAISEIQTENTKTIASEVENALTKLSSQNEVSINSAVAGINSAVKKAFITKVHRKIDGNVNLAENTIYAAARVPDGNTLTVYDCETLEPVVLSERHYCILVGNEGDEIEGAVCAIVFLYPSLSLQLYVVKTADLQATFTWTGTALFAEVKNEPLD